LSAFASPLCSAEACLGLLCLPDFDTLFFFFIGQDYLFPELHWALYTDTGTFTR